MKDYVLWKDVLTAFRSHALRVWTPPMIVEWEALLWERGTKLETNRERQSIEHIIDLLYQKVYEPLVQSDPDVK